MSARLEPVDALASKYRLLRLNISSSNSIAARTAAIVAHLHRQDAEQSNGDASSDARTPLVCLTARSKTANKLVSIVEIAKRQLTASSSPTNPKARVYQYTAVSAEMHEIPREKVPFLHNVQSVAADAEESNDEDGEVAFEPVVTHDPGLKKRKVSVLTIYLSLVSVRELAQQYGEQQ